MTTDRNTIPAIEGGTPVRTMPWPKWPVYDETELAALRQALESGQWWWVGAQDAGRGMVIDFERKWAEYQHAKYAICVPNGTIAIEAALRAAGVGCGDEVIVPPYTFIATATAVLSVGGTPVFADIEADTYLIDPASVEAVCTARTRAVIPVHIAGCPADMDGIMQVAQKNDLVVIEDAAQAHGAEWKGRRVGAIGDMGTFSFQASKNLNCGEGGAIVTDSEDLFSKVWSVHNVGRVPDGGWYEHPVMGSNYRMTEWQGAVLLAQFARLDAQMVVRSANAEYLTSLLNGIDGIRPLKVGQRVTAHANHLYIFRYDSAAFGGRSRDEFARAMSAEGVSVSAGYTPLYREKLFVNRATMGSLCRLHSTDYSQAHCPVCEQACKEAVWLFQSQLLGDRADMDDIAEAILKLQRAWA